MVLAYYFAFFNASRCNATKPVIRLRSCWPLYSYSSAALFTHQTGSKINVISSTVPKLVAVNAEKIFRHTMNIRAEIVLRNKFFYVNWNDLSLAPPLTKSPRSRQLKFRELLPAWQKRPWGWKHTLFFVTVRFWIECSIRKRVDWEWIHVSGAPAAFIITTIFAMLVLGEARLRCGACTRINIQ